MHLILDEWLMHPLVDLEEIGRRHDVVQALVDNDKVRETLHNDFLYQSLDTYQVAGKLDRGKGSLKASSRMLVNE